MKAFKICSCLRELKTTEVKWLTRLMITKKKFVKLYNCPYCGTTGAVGINRKVEV